MARARQLLAPRRRAQPLAQQSAAGGAAAAVEQPQQGWCRLAAQRGEQLEVASRPGVEQHAVGASFDLQLDDVGQATPLGLLGVAQQRGRRGVGARQLAGVERVELGHAELGAQLGLAGRSVELPRRASGQRHAVQFQRERQVLRPKYFGRLDACQPGLELVGGAFGQAQRAVREHQPGQADARRAPRRGRRHGQQCAVGALVEQAVVDSRAGRDDALDAALQRPLRARHVADLFADRHRFAQAHEPRQIGVERLRRHAGHHDRVPGRLAAPRQRQVEQRRGALGVGVEQFIEIAHPVQQQDVRVFGLDAQVLLHHRRVTIEVLRRRGGGWVRVVQKGPRQVGRGDRRREPTLCVTSTAAARAPGGVRSRWSRGRPASIRDSRCRAAASGCPCAGAWSWCRARCPDSRACSCESPRRSRSRRRGSR
ncbi:hypothetical protein GALL_450370 [mine drainage metagenome]|uniref:Uncharacterized protein n=1 Tax=mine drainage metagenome TaxID=410659 RepID=A0A1J5PP23_9ZZZZ